ncbi:MAG: ATP-binding protein [Paludibacteraceae bacterium]|nr:ATP-binding protein [Paludibacteraceae bacterium]
MSELNNPFLLYGYVDPIYFCDRVQETKDLISALKNGRNVTLMSPRRMGKTGLIFNVFHQLQAEQDVACFYIDIFSTKSLESFVKTFASAVVGKLDTPSQRAEGFVQRFFQGLRLTFTTDIFTGNPQVELDFQPEQTETTLEQIFAYLVQSKKECYIAIDEFQQILEYPEKNVEALLRSYVQFCPNVHFIFSGSKQHLMLDIFSSAKRPFFQSTEKMNLYSIDESAYYDFASYWMKKKNIELSKDIFHSLYQQFDGHTWYLQYVLNVLYSDSQSEVTKEDLRNIICRIVQREKEAFQVIYNQLTDNQVSLLKAIAKEGVVKAINASEFIKKYRLKGSSSVNKALEYLIKNEIVYHTSEGYIVYNRFFAIWLSSLVW